MDLARTATVEELAARSGAYDAVVVTCPPTQIASPNWACVHRLAPRRILYGTTSSYHRDGLFFDETSALVETHTRFAAEQRFLEAGGEILRLAGLYGGWRQPRNWLRRGRIGAEPRQVNLVHGDDVAAATLAVLAPPRQHATYVVSDGQRHLWSEIAPWLAARGYLPEPPEPRAPKKPHAYANSQRLLTSFPALRMRNFWATMARELAMHSD